MRTNVVLDDDLVAEAQRLTGTKTKRALIEEALQTLIQVKRGQKRSDQYRERLVQIRSQLAEHGHLDSHELVRRDRDTR